MNRLKSVFIMAYLMAAMAFSGYAAWQIFSGGSWLGWGGVVLATAPLLLLVGFLMMTNALARTSDRLPLVNLIGLAGLGMSAFAWVNGGPFQAVILAAAGWAGFLAYAFWYSSFGGRQPSERIRLGAPLPDFSLKSASGATVTAAQLAGKPTVLIFFRGNWCPLCTAQIKELVDRYQELDALGVRVALISPQPHGNTEALARRFAVPFDFLTDQGNKVARTLGIAHDHGLPFGMQMLGYDSETVLPTVVITDAAGKVIWTHQTDNYRVRPEPDLFLEVIRRNGPVEA